MRSESDSSPSQPRCRGASAKSACLQLPLPAMSAVAAGFLYGIAARIDSFIRPLPFGVELHKLTGLRMRCGEHCFVITCGAETAVAVWRAYDRVLVDARQYIEIDGRRC